MRTILLAAALAATPAVARPIPLPGPAYEVLAAGPASGPRAGRTDSVRLRYIGRLPGGAIFSTSPDGGRETSTFPVRAVVPGFSALVQRMRPGDRWRMHLPAYLAYGAEGKTAAAGGPTLLREIPPDTPLIFEVELVDVIRGAGDATR